MEGGDRDEALSTFIAVTGAEHGVAREAMETNGWDLQRALNTHLEVNHHVSSSQPLNPPQAQAVPQAQRQQQQSSVAAGLHGGVIDLEDDLQDEISLQGRRGSDPNQSAPVPAPAPTAVRAATSANEREVVDLSTDAEDVNERTNAANATVGAVAAGPIDVDADQNYIEEQMLKQALEESMQTANSHGGGGGEGGQAGHRMGPSSSMVHCGALVGTSIKKEDKGKEAAVPSGHQPSHPGLPAATHQGQFSSFDEGPGRIEADNQLGILQDQESPHASHNLQRSNSYSSQDNASHERNMVDSTMVDVHSAGPDASGGPGAASRVEEDIILPDGVNAEEAKMLEAAMFGIPYQGTIPQATAAANPNAQTYRDTISSTSMTPEMRAQRQIRMEQDRAFQASLRQDREKEAQRQAQEMEKRQKLERKLTEERMELEKLEAMKENLRKELSVEPSEPAEDIVNVMIRLPDGTRLSRRFLKQDKVSLLFGFVDYVIVTEKAGVLELKPGGYSLSTQFPRKKIVNTGNNTLEDVGLVNKQEALFCG